MGVLPMFFHRDVEHLAGRGAVNIATLLEGVQPPLLPREPGQHPCLDCGEVRHDEAAPRLGDEGGADQLREDSGGGVVEHLHLVELAPLDQAPGQGQVRNVVLWEVLHLHQPPGPAACAVGTIKLEQPVNSAIRAD